MSQDTAPRHRYAVTFSVVVMVEAETEDKAIDYAEEKLDAGGYLQSDYCDQGVWVSLEDAVLEDV